MSQGSNWAPWHLTSKEVADYFDTDTSKGLTDLQVQKSRDRYGRNEVPEEPGTPFWKLVLSQFEDKLVRILLLAAIISLILAWFETNPDEQVTAFVEPFVIFMILVANATVGVLQEQRAEAAIEALKAYEPELAVVIRDGHIKTVNAGDLVPGDLIEVSVGDKMPADARLLQAQSVTFRIDQSILTGESVAVSKDKEPITNKAPVAQDKINMLFKGTSVVIGKARAIVTGTGIRTEIGTIQKAINQESTISPLRKKLDDFGDLLSKVIGVICVLVWLMNIGHFADAEHGNFIKGAIYYFKIAVALAVAAIPEGLPTVVTTCLALGTMKMAKKNAIVRSLPSVETLGCTTVICSDKTGTLTTNKMSICRVFYLTSNPSDPSNVAVSSFEVAGTSYAPVGAITEGGKTIEKPFTHPSFRTLAMIGGLCNSSSVSYNRATDTYDRVGEPTEVAIKVLVEKIGSSSLKVDSLSKEERALACNKEWEAAYKKLATLEFSRDRKSMSVLAQDVKSGKNQFLVKGAPENVLARCNSVLLNDGAAPIPLTDKSREQILKEVEKFSGEALRCIGLAKIDNAKPFEQYDFNNPDKFSEYENNMCFVGVVGMLDPPRPEVAAAIETCRSAGIRVIVITGDNKLTAESICRKIKVFGQNEELTGKSYTGREFDDLSPEEQKKAVYRASLFSRTEPTHKKRLVELLQAHKDIVAMTGDGVNDAPALSAADIGIGMGSGTAVAKGASKMVLADDNFATIVSAVEEGRAIYNNTKQFIRYLISSNIGEVVCIFLTAVTGMPEALIPVQLLWVNLVTDGLPATALGFNPPEGDVMKRDPRGSDEPIINGWMFFRYMIIGVYVGFATVFGSAYWYMFYSKGPHLTWSQLTSHSQCVGNVTGTDIPCTIYHDNTPSTISLSILVTIEMFNALNSLSENQSIVQMPPWVNPWLIGAVCLSFSLHFVILYVPFLAPIFSATSLGWGEWEIVLLISLPVMILDEILKFVSRTGIVSRQKNQEGLNVNCPSSLRSIRHIISDNNITS